MPIHVVEDDRSRAPAAGRRAAVVAAGLILALLLVAAGALGYLTLAAKPVQLGAYRLCGPRCPPGDAVVDLYLSGRTSAVVRQPATSALVVRSGVLIRVGTSFSNSLVLEDWTVPLWSWGGYRMYGPAAGQKPAPAGTGRWNVW